MHRKHSPSAVLSRPFPLLLLSSCGGVSLQQKAHQGPRTEADLTLQVAAGQNVMLSLETMAVTQGIISNEREAVKLVVLSSHCKKVGCSPN